MASGNNTNNSTNKENAAGGGALGCRKRSDGRRFTKTQEALLRYIAGETMLRGGACCTKKELAELTGRNVKTIDRCLSELKSEGVIEVEMRFDERGAQVSSRYRAVLEAITDT